MAAEQQLERSVLERKERDELRAIAEAMSLEMNSRTKKADMIDEILRAAGVDVAAASSSNGAGTQGPRRRPAQGARGASAAERTSDEEVGNGSTGSNGATADDEDSTNSSGVATEVRAEVAPTSNGQVDQAGASAPRGGGATQTVRQHGAQSANEPGNRRGRRRRGRQSGGPPSDRELQGGGSESQYSGELVPVRGLLDLREEGYGFLRAEGYLPSSRDIYVSISQARRFALRKGDYVEGASRPAASNEKFPALIRIDSVCGVSPEEARTRPRFEDLTPLFPDEKLRLESQGASEVTTRIIDLLSPIGKGQRGMIVSPPKAGKTTILKQIAHAIETNNPEVHLIVLLVEERPEEVTDMRRSVKGEVVASTFDRPSDEHTAISELTIERAKRLVELGRDVVIVLDGITRLSRAYNLAQPATGRIMSGGVDSGALYPPRKFFGAARNIEEGGSLTILATALVETGSKMDEVIFEEFKGTGNMELRLDRRLAERRLYPAIDVNASSTRHEELLFERGQLQQVWKLRRVLNALAADGSAAAGLELLIDKIRNTKSNDEFLAEIAKGPV